jgi:hypothetical protein
MVGKLEDEMMTQATAYAIGTAIRDLIANLYGRYGSVVSVDGESKGGLTGIKIEFSDLPEFSPFTHINISLGFGHRTKD